MPRKCVCVCECAMHIPIYNRASLFVYCAESRDPSWHISLRKPSQLSKGRSKPVSTGYLSTAEVAVEKRHSEGTHSAKLSQRAWLRGNDATVPRIVPRIGMSGVSENFVRLPISPLRGPNFTAGNFP